jgi:hypothetical protein
MPPPAELTRHHCSYPHKMHRQAFPAKSEMGPGCVKTCASRECAELFSPLSPFDRDCQCCSFPIQRNRDKVSTCKFDVGVFTRPGSKPALTAPKRHFRSTPRNEHHSTGLAGPVRAMCGRLRLGKSFLHVLQHWSVQPCVRPFNAVHMTAGP